MCLGQIAFLEALLSTAHSSCFNRKNDISLEQYITIRLKNFIEDMETELNRMDVKDWKRLVFERDKRKTVVAEIKT
jgi:hypothetical protein